MRSARRFGREETTSVSTVPENSSATPSSAA
jgi:hypothetical protein